MESIRCTDPQSPILHQLFAVYEQSFPLHERRSFAAQKHLLAHPQYHCDCLLAQAVPVGLLWYWSDADMRYIEHFAIDPRCRGQQLGSRALTAFLSQPGKVVLEIDPPTTDIARRRQRFYTRLGFCHCPQSHTHPAYHTQFAPHPLVLMAAPAPLTTGEFVRFQHFLRETVMADCPVD